MSINDPNQPPHERGNPYPPTTPQPWSGHSQQHPVVPGNGGQFGQPGPFGNQYGQPRAPGAQGVVAAKTPGIAVLLSFLWLGAGHLYAGRTGAGVTFMVANFFLVLFFLFIPLIGWLIAPVIWVALFVVAAVTASGAVKAHNARWGITGL
jgi:TM2 domain-containing membrane protein YozV